MRSLAPVALAIVVVTVSALVLGCVPEEPYYDDELGIEGVPVEVGALAGTFALKTRTLTSSARTGPE